MCEGRGRNFNTMIVYVRNDAVGIPRRSLANNINDETNGKQTTRMRGIYTALARSITLG
jgi:hypothetical protein